MAESTAITLVTHRARRLDDGKVLVEVIMSSVQRWMPFAEPAAFNGLENCPDWVVFETAQGDPPNWHPAIVLYKMGRYLVVTTEDGLKRPERSSGMTASDA